MDKVIDIINGIIGKEGQEFIDREPYSVYERMIEEKVDPAIARMVLVTLLSGTPAKAEALDKDMLSKEIQKDCFLKRAMADQLAEMYKGIYDKGNLAEWDGQKSQGKKELAGFAEFCEKAWAFEWDGSKDWHSGDRFVTCTCHVETKIQVDDQDLLQDALWHTLEKNPFISADRIYSIVEKALVGTIDSDMEMYVEADEDLEPWMEDYDCRDAIEEFCDNNGLKLIGFSCEGENSEWVS